MKVAIIGSALSGNKGAAAMLESSIQHLTERDPSVRLVLLSMYPAEDAELNTHASLRVLNASPIRLGVAINGGAVLYRILPFLRGAIGRAVPEVEAIGSADVMLDQGGITFVDGREKFLIYNVASILPAVILGTPVVKCAQAMGPFKSRVNRVLAKALLPRMAAIVSRGDITHELATGLGLKNVERGADLAFTLDVQPEDVAAAEAAVDVSFFDGGDVVGVSPSAVLRKKTEAKGGDYVAEIRRMVDYLTEDQGKKVFLVPHSVRLHTESSHNNDLPLCREVYAGLAAPDRVLLPDTELTSQELRYLIGRCNVFVASRFHAMVSSLAMGVPTLVIGWSHKYREVLDMFGLAEWAMGHEDANDSAFREKFERLVAEQDDVRARLSEALPRVRARALEQIATIERVAHRTA